MKPQIRDYLTVLMAFVAVFLCGYGVGHLVGERKTPGPPRHPPAESPPVWQQRTFESIKGALDLSPKQEQIVAEELATTATQIRQSSDAAMLDYHRHIRDLYGRLIDRLDPAQADQLRREKILLEREIEKWLDSPHP